MKQDSSAERVKRHRKNKRVKEFSCHYLCEAIDPEKPTIEEFLAGMEKCILAECGLRICMLDPDHTNFFKSLVSEHGRHDPKVKTLEGMLDYWKEFNMPGRSRKLKSEIIKHTHS